MKLFKGFTTAPSNAGSASGMTVSTPEDPYAFLSSFDTIFIIDDSGSMSGRSWTEVQNVLHAITPISTSHDDDDDVGLYFSNHLSGESTSGSRRRHSKTRDKTPKNALQKLLDRPQSMLQPPVGNETKLTSTAVQKDHRTSDRQQSPPSHQHNGPVVARGHIGGMEVNALADTGAGYNIVLADVAKHLGCYKLEHTVRHRRNREKDAYSYEI